MRKFLILILVLFLQLLNASDLYILKSNYTLKTFLALNIKSDSYLNNLNKLSNTLLEIGYKSKFIKENEINLLKKNDILLLIDSIALEKSIIIDIIKFVKKGGKIIFNANSAFNYKDYLISEITTLRWYNDISHIDLKGEIYLTPKILSPITTYLEESKKIKLKIDDSIPIFELASYLEPDILVTSKRQNQNLINLNNREFSIKDSGVFWHGDNKNGKWVYFNLPIGSILNLESDIKNAIFKGILEYLKDDIIVRKFPFLNKENAIFLSQNGEEKFDNIKNFALLSKRFDIPLTLFLVANEALQNKTLVNYLENQKNIELASFGYTNQIIADGENEYIRREIIGSKNQIDSFGEKRVLGFRPPRYKLTSKMVKYINDAGYLYLIDVDKDKIYPFFENSPLLTIPKTATDDYELLILLGWNDTMSVAKMRNEAQIVLYLNGVYSLNIHSFIMGDLKNVDIIEDLIDFLKQDKYAFFTGTGIYYSLKQVNNINLYVDKKSENFENIVVKNKNKQIVEEFVFRVYLKPNHQIKALFCEDLNLNYKKRIGLNEYDIIAKKLKPDKKYKISIEY